MRPELQQHVSRLFPGARLVAIEPLSPDSGATAGSTAKAAGYGEPMRLVLDDHGRRRELVWRVAGANEFGHDRRSDRAAETLLAFDDFARIPRHVAALDVGAIRDDGELVSLRDAGELYLVTTYARARCTRTTCARIAAERRASDRDVARVDALAALSGRAPRAARPPSRRATAARFATSSAPARASSASSTAIPTTYRRRRRRGCARSRSAAPTWRWRLRDRHDPARAHARRLPPVQHRVRRRRRADPARREPRRRAAIRPTTSPRSRSTSCCSRSTRAPRGAHASRHAVAAVVAALPRAARPDPELLAGRAAVLRVARARRVQPAVLPAPGAARARRAARVRRGRARRPAGSIRLRAEELFR